MLFHVFNKDTKTMYKNKHILANMAQQCHVLVREQKSWNVLLYNLLNTVDSHSLAAASFAWKVLSIFLTTSKRHVSSGKSLSTRLTR